MSKDMNRVLIPAMKRQRGFTLIELMVVVAIMAIIATMAVQGFSGAGNDAKRARGMSDISALNDAVGRYYVTSSSYTGAESINTAAGLTSAGLSLSTDYTFTIVVPADGQSYSVRATPPTSSVMYGDGSLAIDNIGRRCYYPGATTPNYTTCPKPF